jgi:hypothetical protein
MKLEFTKKEVKEMLKPKNLLEFNREISERHSNTLAKSINECGVLRYPVIGNISKFDKRKYVIVDGQHLCFALVNMSKNKAKINCIVKDYETKEQLIKDVATLNNVNKTWTDKDYLHAWFKYGISNINYFTNYSYLWNMYETYLDCLPCGYLVDLYSNNKDDFRTGKLEFKDRVFSDKLAQISCLLKNDFNKGSFTLQGLRTWAFEMHRKNIEIDFEKLKLRIMTAIMNNEDNNCNGRDDFRDLIEEVYNRI